MSPAERPLEPRQGRGRVAIGLPVFNGMPYLPESLSSLRAQDEPDIEIIISDNASDDGTEEYCRSIAAQDPRICYERSATNEGAAANFQRVVSLSTAPFFAWAAHDDTYSPDFVSSCLGVLDEHPEAGLCTPAHRVIDETGAFVKMSYEPPGLASSDLETRLRAHMWRIGRLTLYGLWRRDVLERIGPPLPIWGSDVVLVWRALLVGPVQTIPRPLNDYRVFREKTVDATMFGLTATESRAHFAHTRVRYDLLRASDGLGLSADQLATAEHVLRRWTLTRHYRELAFADLWVETRRLWAQGAHSRALAFLPAMAVLSPRRSLEGIRRAFRYRRPAGQAR
jgi:glycosyltransferase involved in cell wall biosynthesis